MAALTVVQSLVVGLGCLALAACLPGGLPPLPRDGAFWLATFYLVGGCTVFASVAQNRALRHSAPSRVGLLMGTEPAWGALFAVAWLGETLDASGWVGRCADRGGGILDFARAWGTLRGVLLSPSQGGFDPVLSLLSMPG